MPRGDAWPGVPLDPDSLKEFEMTEDDVEKAFKQMAQPRSTRLAAMVIAWAFALGVVACVLLGVIALARAVFR